MGPKQQCGNERFAGIGAWRSPTLAAQTKCEAHPVITSATGQESWDFYGHAGPPSQEILLTSHERTADSQARVSSIGSEEHWVRPLSTCASLRSSSPTKYSGRRLASLNVLPRYSPSTPIESSWTPPRNRIVTIKEG